MRLPNLENFNNSQLIERRSIGKVPRIERNIVIMSDKDKHRVITQIERIVRSSIEYREYIAFLKKEIDMTQCSFYNNITTKEGRKASLEIHHEPFTLFDITKIVLDKWIANGEQINVVLIAEEIMKLHYQDKVGLIPLSKTVHELVHNGKVFIPLQSIYGEFITFLEEYDEYIGEDIKDMLEEKFTESRKIEANDLSILETKYIYLEVEGFKLPHIIELPEK